MPTYVYYCDACAETFDVTASIKQKEAGLVLVSGGRAAGGCCQA